MPAKKSLKPAKASSTPSTKAAAKPTKKAAAKAPSGVSVYQIKITLGYSKPAIWRRVLVKSDTRFDKFHKILQLAMGWTNSHLHQFIVGQHPTHTLICDPYPGVEELAPRVLDQHEVKLSDVVTGAKQRLFYEYDFGDGWEHEILVEKILKPDAGVYYPVCIDGKRACPPEDCGGIWGYYNFLAAIKDEDHPDHEDQLDWVGGEFDPEAFDLDETNKALKRIK